MTRTIARAILTSAPLVALAAVVACGGGGGGGQANLPVAAKQSQAVFTVTVPSATGTSSTQRSPKFVSPNTQSITIALASTTLTSTSGGAGVLITANLTPTSPNCTPAAGSVPLTCTIGVNAPAGNDTFALTMYQGLNGTGNVLSSAIVSAQISATETTTVPVTLSGVISSVDVTVTNGNNVVPGGFATSLPVVVTAKDASGAAIVGPGNYASPITLTNADTSGVTTLSTTNVTSPATSVTLAYAPTDANGGELAINGLPIGATTISAAVAGLPASASSPGTFQYVADRFFGYGHMRMLSGTGSANTTSYNNLGVVTGTTSYTYSVTDALTIHNAVLFNGTPYINSHHVFTYTQTTPVTAVPAEVDTHDQYRGDVVTPTGSALYRYGEQEVDVNSGAVNSPITGNVAGTTNITYVYPVTGGWKEDVLPHVTGAAWSNTNVPFSVNYTNAEVATFQLMADGSTTFVETAPSNIQQTQSAAGVGTNAVDNGAYIVNTEIGLPSAGTIPIAQQTTSPVTSAVNNINATDWYPNGGTLTPPLYTYAFSEGLTSIPGLCNVPASIATQAYVLIQINNQIDVPAFRSRQQVWADYYVPNGIGFVCENYTETTSNYRYSNGVISSLELVSYIIGVPNTGSLSVRRTP